MCGVRYANNLLKNPATKRLSGKISINFNILIININIIFHNKKSNRNLGNLNIKYIEYNLFF